MAAWFAMLLLLVAALLTGAARIDTPKWIPGFLVISSVGLSILVMAAVFVMLTKFRPHLQGPKEYAEWIKDERMYRVQVSSHVETQGAQVYAQRQSIAYAVRATPRIEGAKYDAQVSNLPGVASVIESLRQLGLQARIYREDFGGGARRNKSQLASIWVGRRVPAHIAIPAIKAAVKSWPHLRYVSISGDHNEGPPDEVHEEMFFGGSTSTATGEGLEPWTVEEFQSLPDDLPGQNFHARVRAKYAGPMDPPELE